LHAGADGLGGGGGGQQQQHFLERSKRQ
jgi:hypothetical protein